MRQLTYTVLISLVGPCLLVASALLVISTALMIVGLDTGSDALAEEYGEATGDGYSLSRGMVGRTDESPMAASRVGKGR